MENLIFFDLAARWKEERFPEEYFVVLKAVMNYYFDTIIGKRNPKEFILVGSYDPAIVANVLSAVGYFNYDFIVEDGFIRVRLRNTL